MGSVLFTLVITAYSYDSLFRLSNDGNKTKYARWGVLVALFGLGGGFVALMFLIYCDDCRGGDFVWLTVHWLSFLLAIGISVIDYFIGESEASAKNEAKYLCRAARFAFVAIDIPVALGILICCLLATSSHIFSKSIEYSNGFTAGGMAVQMVLAGFAFDEAIRFMKNSGSCPSNSTGV